MANENRLTPYVDQRWGHNLTVYLLIQSSKFHKGLGIT